MITEAILELRPGALFVVRGETYEDMEWHSRDISKPTKQEVEEKIEELKQRWVANTYQRQRKQAYPSIEEQLDKLYHDGYDGWKAIIQEVKDAYPKP